MVETGGQSTGFTHQVYFIVQSQIQRIRAPDEILQHPLPETHLVMGTIGAEGGGGGVTDAGLSHERARSLNQLLDGVDGDLEDLALVDDVTGKVVQLAE